MVNFLKRFFSAFYTSQRITYITSHRTFMPSFDVKAHIHIFVYHIIFSGLDGSIGPFGSDHKHMHGSAGGRFVSTCMTWRNFLFSFISDKISNYFFQFMLIYMSLFYGPWTGSN